MYSVFSNIQTYNYRNQAWEGVIDWKNQCQRILDVQSCPEGRRPEGMMYRQTLDFSINHTFPDLITFLTHYSHELSINCLSNTPTILNFQQICKTKHYFGCVVSHVRRQKNVSFGMDIYVRRTLTKMFFPCMLSKS